MNQIQPTERWRKELRGHASAMLQASINANWTPATVAAHCREFANSLETEFGTNPTTPATPEGTRNVSEESQESETRVQKNEINQGEGSAEGFDDWPHVVDLCQCVFCESVRAKVKAAGEDVSRTA